MKIKLVHIIRRVFIYSIKIYVKFCDFTLSLFRLEKVSSDLYSYFRNSEKIIEVKGIGDIKFFTPSTLLKWRADTLLSKEPETLDWMDSFDDDQEHIFWDIGANIGLYSIYAALKHKNIKVYSFEPSTSNLPILSRNISLNNLSKNVHICPFALTSESFGFQAMNETSFEEGGALNSFGVSYGFDGRDISASSSYSTIGFSIDYLVNNKIIESPTYVKIDVDGIEHLIIEGALDTLGLQSVKSLCIELNSDFKDQYDYVHKTLEGLNFKFEAKLRSEMFEDTDYDNVYNYFFTKVGN